MHVYLYDVQLAQANKELSKEGRPVEIGSVQMTSVQVAVIYSPVRS